jgi:hypothetical protein
MRRALLVVCTVALIAPTFTACNRSGSVRRVVTAEGEMLLVKDRYAMIILSPDMMRRTFGPKWDELSLFYGSNRGLTSTGERAALASSPFRSVAKGAPVLVFSGDAWSDLIAPIYALETRQQATFAIDTTKGSIRVLTPAQTRAGTPEVTADGHLFFR